MVIGNAFPLWLRETSKSSRIHRLFLNTLYFSLSIIHVNLITKKLPTKNYGTNKTPSPSHGPESIVNKIRNTQK